MNKGKIVEISGPVIDVEFIEGNLPKIKDALYVEVDGKKRVMEVASHLGDKTVRCIMLDMSEGLARGNEVISLDKGIEVPVGENTLGRMFNVLGEPIDGMGDIDPNTPKDVIHKSAPKFEDQMPISEILETGIKVVDLLEPYPKGGKIGFSSFSLK